jgi:hypothetical protein
VGHQAKNNVSESCLHYPSDQTLFCVCEKFRGRARLGHSWPGAVMQRESVYSPTNTLPLRIEQVASLALAEAISMYSLTIGL